MFRGLGPAHQDGKDWLGRRKISPCVSVLELLSAALGHALLLLPSCRPEHPDTNAATPNSWRQVQGVTPNLLALLLLSQARQGWLRREMGIHAGSTPSDFHPKHRPSAHSHRSQILPPSPSTPPHPHPRPRLSYIQEGRFFN